MNILDAGCCSGLFTLYFFLLCKKNFKKFTFTAIDLSQDIIDKAKENI